MDLILNSLVPLTFVIALGWSAGWRKIVDSKYSTHFATYVISISFPCLLLVKTATSKIDDLINYRFIGGLALGLLGMYLIVFLINHYIYRRSVSHSCQSSFMCAFPNMAFMGIPIFMVLFGEQSLVSIVIGNIITSLIMIPLTVSILELSQDSQVKTSIVAMIAKVFTKPLVLAPIGGFIISALNFKLPALALDSLKMIGNTTSGVSLFTLGLLISANKIHLDRYVISNVLCKNFIHPLIMYGIVIAFGIGGDWGKEAILLCAMPSAITATMFAAKYDVLKVESSGSAVIGTLLSLLSLAFVMRMLGIGV
jgi:malonate transporter and related proteins